MKQFLLDGAEALDALRIFPRLILTGYGYLCWHLTIWFEALKIPSTEQMAFAGAVIGLATPLVGLYMATGRKWGKDDEANR